MRIRVLSSGIGRKYCNFGMTVYGNLDQIKENHSKYGMIVRFMFLTYLEIVKWTKWFLMSGFASLYLGTFVRFWIHSFLINNNT